MDDTEKIVLLTIILRKRRRKKKLFGQHVQNRLTRISSSCKGSVVKKIHLAFQKVNITVFIIILIEFDRLKSLGSSGNDR